MLRFRLHPVHVPSLGRHFLPLPKLADAHLAILSSHLEARGFSVRLGGSKGKLVAVQQELGQVNQSLQVITNDQTRLRANLREMPSTAAAYKRYLEKFDKQETEIEKLQEQQKKLQAGEHGARQEFEAYLNNLNVK